MSKITNFRFVVDLFTPTFQELKFVWGTFGVKQIPSVIYKVSLVEIEREAELSKTNLISQIPTFKIHFKNRETFGVNKRVSDDSEIFTTASANLLIKYGFIEVNHTGDQFPNLSVNHLIPDNNNFFQKYMFKLRNHGKIVQNTRSLY